MESMKLARSTKNDKRGRVAQLPRANISLRHEIYIQRCTLFARKRRSSRFEKHRSYCDSIALPRENFKTKRVGHVEIRTRSRRKKENEKKFSTLHVRVYTYVRDLGSEYGANKGNWTRIFNSAKEVASFVLRLGRGLFPALLLQGRLTWNSPPPLSSSPIKYLSSKSIVAFGIRFKNLRALNIPIFFLEERFIIDIFIFELLKN